MKTKNEFYTIVDNFDEVCDMLFGEKNRPLGKDEFYFLQILVRGKDGNKVSGNNKNRLVKYYRIHSKEQLLDLKNEIIGICEVVNGRAYIHPTRRDANEVAKIALELTTRTYVCGNWIGLQGVYSTACGKSYVKNDKKYIVDLDDMEKGDLKYEDIKKTINSLRGKGDDKIFGELQTKDGWHLITTPFDVDRFKEIYPNIDVHKNNPTLLYYYKNHENV